MQHDQFQQILSRMLYADEGPPPKALSVRTKSGREWVGLPETTPDSMSIMLVNSDKSSVYIDIDAIESIARHDP